MAKPDRPRRRMLLAASIGVATVSYLVAACEKHPAGAGNLMPPPRLEPDSSISQPVATGGDAGAPVAVPTVDPEPSPVTGNLMMPTPQPQPTTSASAKPPKLRPLAPHPTGGNLMQPSTSNTGKTGQ